MTRTITVQDGPTRRTIALLRLLAAGNDGNGQWAASEIADALDLARPTAYRMLKIFEAEGLVRQDPDTKLYQVGIELHRIASALFHKMPIEQVALPVMRDLVARCNETVVLCAFNHVTNRMTFLEKVDCEYPLRYFIEIGTSQPVHASAGGKAMLAFLPQETIDRIVLESPLEKITAATVTEPGRLLEELAIIRQRGYSITRGQRIPGDVGIAAPIFDARQGVFGSLAVTIPEQRFSEDREAVLAKLTMEAARLLSGQVG